MRTWLRLLALGGLIGALTVIFLAFDIHAHGALNMAGTERFPGANQVAVVASTITVVGMLSVLAGTLLGILYSVRHHWWIWACIVLGLAALSLYANANAGFTADPMWALLTLTAPLGLVILSLQPANESAA
jgi:hypothetical protein